MQVDRLVVVISHHLSDAPAPPESDTGSKRRTRCGGNGGPATEEPHSLADEDIQVSQIYLRFTSD
jgi:hypothetical protein